MSNNTRNNKTTNNLCVYSNNVRLMSVCTADLKNGVFENAPEPRNAFSKMFVLVLCWGCYLYVIMETKTICAYLGKQ